MQALPPPRLKILFVNCGFASSAFTKALAASSGVVISNDVSRGW